MVMRLLAGDFTRAMSRSRFYITDNAHIRHAALGKLSARRHEAMTATRTIHYFSWLAIDWSNYAYSRSSRCLLSEDISIAALYSTAYTARHWGMRYCNIASLHCRRYFVFIVRHVFICRTYRRIWYIIFIWWSYLASDDIGRHCRGAPKVVARRASPFSLIAWQAKWWWRNANAVIPDVIWWRFMLFRQIMPPPRDTMHWLSFSFIDAFRKPQSLAFWAAFQKYRRQSSSKMYKIYFRYERCR